MSTIKLTDAGSFMIHTDASLSFNSKETKMQRQVGHLVSWTGTDTDPRIAAATTAVRSTVATVGASRRSVPSATRFIQITRRFQLVLVLRLLVVVGNSQTNLRRWFGSLMLLVLLHSAKCCALTRKQSSGMSKKFTVRDFGAYAAMMEKLEEEGLKDAVNLLVATPVDSIDQYEAKAKTVENEYGHYGFTALVRLISDAAHAAQSCALENMLKEACDEAEKKIAKFRAPSTCRQYKSACACVLASKLRDQKDDNRLMPLSQEEDNLLNQMCNSYEVQFAQMVCAGFIEPKKGGRGALRRTMLDQLIQLAEQE